jgi:tetratricopeptide (TPR) repeat protein/tRNA A-37 threonylcarbamoyl transferase component Bud32
VQQLLDELLDSCTTPEVICRDCPELLPEVRRRWEQMLIVEAELDVLFPTTTFGPEAESGSPWQAGAELPRIPGYEVGVILGRGGMGIVYKARHNRLNRFVALKMLIAGRYAGPRERERFQREAEAVASLGHANIVAVYDVGDHEGCPYFTMEFLEGGSLAQALAGTPQPSRRAAEVVTTLAEAMQVAHRGGIVHRDLKPANILLAADGTPKIADFGLARHFNEDPAFTLSGARVGTPSYMAPEQVMGKSGAVGPATDIYALGAILYEMLTGRPPFRGEVVSETERQVIAEEPVPPSRLNAKVPRDLETICLTCLHKVPQRRYADAGALIEDLRRFQEGRPIRARRISPLERAWRWCRRNPAGAALTVTVLVLIILSAGAALRIQQQQLERRVEAQLRRERARLAIERALVRHEHLRQQGLWEDANVELAQAETYLPEARSDELHRKLGQARSDLTKAIRAEAQDPALLVHMAEAEAQLGRVGRVESLLKRLAAHQPRDPRTWVQTAVVRDRLGRTEQAAADFARALELVPQDPFFASARSSLVLELAGHDRIFSALLAKRPDDTSLWIGRGRHYALREQWRRAAADFARGIGPAASPGTHESYEYACSLLLAGYKERYRALIQSLDDQADEPTDAPRAYEMARACIIAPEMATDPTRVIRWARLAVDKSPLPWHIHALGAAHFRAGDYNEALRWLDHSLVGPWDNGRIMNKFVQAMVYQRMGDTEKAASVHAEAVRLYEELESRRVNGAVPLVFAADWMTIQIYRTQAESLIKHQ